MASAPGILTSSGGTKKPFTYCPGGINFNELKSPKMARRIAKHQSQMENTQTLPSRNAAEAYKAPENDVSKFFQRFIIQLIIELYNHILLAVKECGKFSNQYTSKPWKICCGKANLWKAKKYF